MEGAVNIPGVRKVYGPYKSMGNRLIMLLYYDDGSKHTMSYPRFLLTNSGYILGPDQFVHHKNGDPQDNSFDNLQIMGQTEHLRLHNTIYSDDVVAICVECGGSFVFTVKQQRRFASNRGSTGRTGYGPFCSRQCVGRYGQRRQAAKAKQTKKI